jgi:hypothetical protein
MIVSGSSLIDVDADEARPIDGLPALDEQSFWAIPADDSAIISATCTGCTNPEVFVLDRGSQSAVRIGTGFASPAPDGVWLKNYLTATSCTASKVGFDGSIIRPVTPVDCESAPISESAERRWPQVEAPTSIGTPSAGQLSPDGTLLAVAYSHPAWPGPRQRLDVWVLDLDTLAWTELPSMPVAAALKVTAYQWLADGRFAIFGDFDHVGSALATWQPGDPELVVRPLTGDTSQAAVMWCTLGDACEAHS